LAVFLAGLLLGPGSKRALRRRHRSDMLSRGDRHTLATVFGPEMAHPVFDARGLADRRVRGSTFVDVWSLMRVCCFRRFGTRVEPGEPRVPLISFRVILLEMLSDGAILIRCPLASKVGRCARDSIGDHPFKLH